MGWFRQRGVALGRRIEEIFDESPWRTEVEPSSDQTLYSRRRPRRFEDVDKLENFITTTERRGGNRLEVRDAEGRTWARDQEPKLAEYLDLIASGAPVKHLTIMARRDDTGTLREIWTLQMHVRADRVQVGFGALTFIVQDPSMVGAVKELSAHFDRFTVPVRWWHDRVLLVPGRALDSIQRKHNRRIARMSAAIGGTLGFGGAMLAGWLFGV